MSAAENGKSREFFIFERVDCKACKGIAIEEHGYFQYQCNICLGSGKASECVSLVEAMDAVAKARGEK